jgi:hypothetical protein
MGKSTRIKKDTEQNQKGRTGLESEGEREPKETEQNHVRERGTKKQE